jgi:hypothetical protein
MHPYAEELRSLFRVKYGCHEAEEAMARELIELNLRLLKLERMVSEMEKDRHRAFHRESPIYSVPVETPRSVDPVDDDSWIETGKETNHE